MAIESKMEKVFLSLAMEFGNWPAQLTSVILMQSTQQIKLVDYKIFSIFPSGSTFIGNLASSERKMQSKSMYSFSKSQGLPRGKGKTEPVVWVSQLQSKRNLSLPGGSLFKSKHKKFNSKTG